MFLGLGPGRDRDQNFSTCWPLLELGFKFYLILELLMTMLSYFLSSIFDYFPNIVSLTVQKLQLWRIFSSFLFPSSSKFAILSVLFMFYMLYMCMPDLEKKYSTAYMLLEVILQVAISNVTLTVIAYPFIYFGIVEDGEYLVGYGMHPALFYFIWCKVAQNPDQPTRFWCCPCLMPMKYVPLCLLLLYVSFGYLVTIIYCLLGYYQAMVIKTGILRLPISIYRKIDALMPESLKEKQGYIKVVKVEGCLRKKCWTEGCCSWGSSQPDPFNEQQGDIQSSSTQPGKEKVEVIGGGVQIGGTGKRNPKKEGDFKNHWKDKELQEGQQGMQNFKNQEQNRQNLQSDEHFEDCNQSEVKSTAKPLNKRPNNNEVDNKSEMSDLGLTQSNYENDEK